MKKLNAIEKDWKRMSEPLSAWEYRGNEVHLFAPQKIDKIIITRNGQRFEIDLPKKLPPNK